MRKLLLTLGAAATLASGMVATTATTASADSWRGGWHRGGYHGGGYHGGGGWDGDRWRYRHHRSSGGDALAAGAIGLGVGALLGSAIGSQPYSDGRFYGRGYYGNGYYGGGYYGRPDDGLVEGPVYRERRVYYRPVPVYRDYRPVRAYSRGYSHADACAARYRTYDERTDTYIASAGVVRRCRL